MKKVKFALIIIFTVILSASSFIAVSAVNAERSEKPEWIDVVWSDSNEFLEKDLPSGVKGKSYPLPVCVAVDNNGNTLTDLQYTVKDGDNKTVLVKDGRFATAAAGVYTIKYTVQYAGLSAEKSVYVNVADSCEELSYEINSDIPDKVFTSESVVLLSGKSAGGVGNISVGIKVLFNGEEEKIYNFGGNSYFKAVKSGVYDLNYILSDYVGNEKTFSKQIVAERSDLPILETVNVSPKIQKGDNKIKVPVATAVVVDADDYSYSVPVKVYYDDVDITKDMFFTATASGKHTLKYKAVNPMNKSAVSEKTYEIEISDFNDESLYDKNYAFISNYISTDNCSYAFDANGYLSMSVADGQSGKLNFSNKIKNNFLNFEISVNSSKNEFEGVSVTICDYVRLNESIELFFKKSDVKNKTDVYLNGNFVSVIDYSFTEYSDKRLKVQLDCKNNVLYCFDAKICDVSAYYNGTPFSGFSSTFAKAGFGIVNAYGKNEVFILSLSDVSITDSSSDGAAPVLVKDEKYESVYNCEINDKLTFYPVEFYDFTNENLRVEFTVFKPSGEILLTSLNDKPETIVLSEYGTYSFRYIAYDSYDNHKPVYGSVYVLDRVAPTIRLKGDIKAEYKQGDVISLPKAVVSDNNTPTENLVVYAYVIHNGLTSTILDKDAFTFSKAGSYTFRFAVYDKNMNHVYIEYTTICR